MKNSGFLPNCGEIIKGHRMRAGLTQRALASAINTAPSTINRIELGLAIPKSSTLLKIATVLGFDINSLLISDEIVTETRNEISNLKELIIANKDLFLSSRDELSTLIKEETSKIINLLSNLDLSTKKVIDRENGNSSEDTPDLNTISTDELLKFFAIRNGYAQQLVIDRLKEALLTNPIGVSVILRLPPPADFAKKFRQKK